MKKLFNRFNVIMLLNAVAIIGAIQSVNVACSWVHYQPEVPEGMEKFKKL